MLCTNELAHAAMTPASSAIGSSAGWNGSSMQIMVLGVEVLLVLLTAPNCSVCKGVEVSVQTANDLLLVPFSAKLSVVDVTTPAGAAIQAALCPWCSLPSPLILHDSSEIWWYNGPTNAPTLVSLVDAWMTSRQPPAQSASSHHLLGRWPAGCHLRDGAPASEPSDSRVQILTSANFTAALIDLPLALIFVYGSETSAGVDAWGGAAKGEGSQGEALAAQKQMERFRNAAALLHSRGITGTTFKAFVASGRASSFEEPTCSADPGVGSAFDGADWRAAVRAISPNVAAAQRISGAIERQLPRILMLRDGLFEVYRAPVVHEHDLVDVMSYWNGRMRQQQQQQQQQQQVVSVPTLTANTFSSYAEPRPFLFTVFTNHWCGKCLEVNPQLSRAAMLIKRLHPKLPISMAIVDVSDPKNAKWLDDTGIYSFPTGHVYSYGTAIREYTGGPKASHIAQELMKQAEALSAAMQKDEGVRSFRSGLPPRVTRADIQAHGDETAEMRRSP